MQAILDKEYFTFDDVLLRPQYSDLISRQFVDLRTKVGPMQLRIPIVAANMSAIAGIEMARAMDKLGGKAWIHRFMDKNSRHFYAYDGNPMCIGASGDEVNLGKEFIDHGCDNLTIDVAHGDHYLMVNALKELRAYDKDVILCGGNVGTWEGFQRLADAGADIVRAGIGGGAVCSTRSVTGHGVPQLSLILEIEEFRQAQGYGHIGLIADGGINSSGDIVKAIAAGADAVMIGKLIAGTDECPGKIHTSFNLKTQSFERKKEYFGMASTKAQTLREDSAYVRTAEGIHSYVPYKGSLENVIKDLCGGIRSGCSYSGVYNLEDLKKKAIFIRVSRGSYGETMTRV